MKINSIPPLSPKKIQTPQIFFGHPQPVLNGHSLNAAVTTLALTGKIHNLDGYWQVPVSNKIYLENNGIYEIYCHHQGHHILINSAKGQIKLKLKFYFTPSPPDYI